MAETSPHEGIDWDGLADRALNMALTILGNKIQGTPGTPIPQPGQSSTPAGPISNTVLLFGLGAVVVIGAVLIFRK
jgi:hypothetical protein